VAKKDFVHGLETATRGTEYASNLLPMFYDLIAESYDADGKPEKAIEAYTRGIQVVDDPSMLYYNMAITYLESLKNPEEARRALEKGAMAAPTEPAIQAMLGQVFHTAGYETPAFLAFSTYLIFEPSGPRSLQAIGLWRAILRGGLAAASGAPGGVTADGAMRRPPNGGPAGSATAPASEVGDFSEIDRQFAVGQQRVIEAMDQGAGEMPTLLAQIDDVLTRLAARDPERDRATFTGRQYLPYFAELKQKNFVEPFVYWALQRAPVSGVREWLDANRDRVQAFLDWTRAYRWPAA
jgi:tetratricopeptide (TPR) repeat protein